MVNDDRKMGRLANKFWDDERHYALGWQIFWMQDLCT